MDPSLREDPTMPTNSPLHQQLRQQFLRRQDERRLRALLSAPLCAACPRAPQAGARAAE
jgi:hypothetical protein